MLTALLGSAISLWIAHFPLKTHAYTPAAANLVFGAKFSSVMHGPITLNAPRGTAGPRIGVPSVGCGKRPIGHCIVRPSLSRSVRGDCTDLECTRNLSWDNKQ